MDTKPPQAGENSPLLSLASQLEDVMHQAKFIADWTQAGKLNTEHPAIKQ